jgi:hypothetical protein
MKVTFVFYRYSTGKIDLVQHELPGNKPTKEQWEMAVEDAGSRLTPSSSALQFEGEVARDLLFALRDYSVVTVLKGLVSFEPRAIDNLDLIVTK